MALDREQVGLLFKLKADSSEAQRTLTQFRGTVNNAIGDMRGRFDGLANSVAGFSSSLSGGLGGLAGSLTGVAGLAAGAAASLGALALQTANYAGQVADLAAKTNLSTDTLQSLKLAATLTGQSFESVSETAVIFQRRIEEAKTGNDRLKATFDALQINLNGPVDDAFRQTLERLSGIEDGSQKTAAAVDLFGRSGASLLPIMGQVGGSFENLEQRARDLGIVLSEDAIAKADEFGDQIDILKLQLGGLANQIGSIVIPAISNYVSGLSNAITFTQRAADSTKSYTDRLLDAAKAAALFASYLNPLPSGAASRLLLTPGGSAGRGFEGPGLDPNTGLPIAQLPGRGGGGGAGGAGGRAARQETVRLPIRDFSQITEEYFKSLERLENEQIKRLDQAQARSVRVQEEILQAAQDREIAALQDQIDQKVITEEEGAARIAAVRVAAFARYEDQINRQLSELDEQITTAAAQAQARPFDNVLQARLRALQAERELVRNQLTLLQDERTAIEEEGNRAIAAARDRDLQDLLAYAEEQKRIYQDLQQTRLEAERLDPLSARSIFGDAFADTLRRTGSEMLAFKATFADFAASIRQESADLGSLADTALNSFTQGLAAMVEQFVLTGTTGPAALRQLTASVLLNVAKMAAVKAIFALAEGFIQLALFNFPAAAAAFKAAALYGAVAVAAGAAGAVIAPSSSAGGNFTQSGSSQNNGRRIIEQGDRQRPEPQIIIIRAETEPGVVVRKVVEDYRGNGESRKLLRRDMLGEGG